MFDGLVKLVVAENQIVLGKQSVFVGGYFVVEGEQVLHQFVIGGQIVAADDVIGGQRFESECVGIRCQVFERIGVAFVNIADDGDMVLLQMLQHVGVNQLGFGLRFGQFDGIAVRIAGERRGVVVCAALNGIFHENHIIRL